MEWTGTEELYPIVFDTVGDWSVDTAVSPPEGFVSDYDPLTEEVTNEVEAVQFTITDIGCDWIPTRVKQALVHAGRRKKVLSCIGVRLGRELAARKGLDRFGRVLGEDGHPIPASDVDPRDARAAEIAG